jgi:hypothetical protein
MQVVFYDMDDEELVRKDIVCLAVVYYFEDNEFIPNSFIEPMIGDESGFFCNPCWEDNFIGVEYNGKEENWDEEIRELEARMETEDGKLGLN